MKSFQKLTVLVLFVVFLFVHQLTFAQSTVQDLSEAFRLEEKRAMHILLGWSGVSLLGTGVLYGMGRKDQAVMHSGWALINAGIAGASLMASKPVIESLAGYLEAEQQFNFIVALNTGLDVAYVSTGVLMNYWGKSRRIREFGTAVAIQGSFLLVFDAVLWYRSQGRLQQGFELIQQLSDLPESQAVLMGLRYWF